MLSKEDRAKVAQFEGGPWVTYHSRVRRVAFGNLERRTKNPERWDWRLLDYDPRFKELGKALLVEKISLKEAITRFKISRRSLTEYLKRLGYKYVKTGMWDWTLVKRDVAKT